ASLAIIPITPEQCNSNNPGVSCCGPTGRASSAQANGLGSDMPRPFCGPTGRANFNPKRSVRHTQSRNVRETAETHLETIARGRRGPSGPSAIHGLASVYSDLQRFDLAEPLYVELIEVTRRLRPDHPNLMNFKNGLALLWFRQSKFDKAEMEYREVLAAQQAK